MSNQKLSESVFRLLTTCPFLAIAAAAVLHQRSLGRAQTSYCPSFCGFLPLIPRSHTEKGAVVTNLETRLARDPSDSAEFILALHSLPSTRKAWDARASLFTQHMRVRVPEGSWNLLWKCTWPFRSLLLCWVREGFGTGLEPTCTWVR